MQHKEPTGIKIGLVDDHQLFSKSLGLLLSSFKNVKVVVDAINGKDLQEKLPKIATAPDIMLIDVSMPVMDGPQTAEWLCEAFPKIHLVALSMDDKEQTVIKMLKAGCCAYLFKDIHPNDLEKALHEIYRVGYYNPALSYQRLIAGSEEMSHANFTDREIEFLKLSCSDLTYREVAMKMSLSERAIDGYRESLFRKLNVQSRTGMALEAIRKGLVVLS
jgi:DNA-binding NarL/FixJ family response regulator